MTAPDPQCLTIKGAASLISVSEATFYRLLRSGQIRRTKCGARTLIRVAELNRYLDDNTQRGEA